jgi:hypothetical protein
MPIILGLKKTESNSKQGSQKNINTQGTGSKMAWRKLDDV